MSEPSSVSSERLTSKAKSPFPGGGWPVKGMSTGVAMLRRPDRPELWDSGEGTEGRGATT